MSSPDLSAIRLYLTSAPVNHALTQSSNSRRTSYAYVSTTRRGPFDMLLVPFHSP